MKRFVFSLTGTSDEDINNCGDEKAIVAFNTAQILVSDTTKNMTVLLLLSFDMGATGLAFAEIAQFLYDNYEIHQIKILFISLSNPSELTTRKVTYSSEKELKELKEEAAEHVKNIE